MQLLRVLPVASARYKPRACNQDLLRLCPADLCLLQQPLSLLLKTSSLIDELALYDVVNTPGVAADLSHISSRAVRLRRS